jgi:hypothetical protein
VFPKLANMKKLLQIIKLMQLFVLLPIQIAKGSKKRAYLRIKELMVAANLL